MVAEQPGRLSPLLVYGPTGVGKTHLLEGIWSAARRSRPGIHAVYLSAEQFTTYFLEALHGSGLPSFRRKYRGVELLIIDGLQFFAGKRATLNELLHTTDTLLREGRQLVFAADRAAADLRELSDELVARLSSGMACGIDPPDYPTRLGILRQLAQARGLALTDDVASFVATHLTAHARELSGALNRLEAAARMLHEPITRSLAEEALAEMIRHNARAVRLGDIDRAVCEVFGLEPESLQSSGRGRKMSASRGCSRCGWPESTRGPRWRKSAATSAAAATARSCRRRRPSAVGWPANRRWSFPAAAGTSKTRFAGSRSSCGERREGRGYRRQATGAQDEASSIARRVDSLAVSRPVACSL